MSMQVAEFAAPVDVRLAAVRARRFVSPGYYEAFEGICADTEPLLAECFRVRHQIYCRERNLLPAADHPAGFETDEYDTHSRHGLLRYRKTGEAVGTVRVVLPEASGLGLSLPMYALFERCGLDLSALPPASATTEISRFAISRDFRRRLGDALHGAPVDHPAVDDRRIIPHMALGLMALAFRMSTQANMEYFCAIMEPTLIRLLARFGIRWQEIGAPIEYHGLRQPCIGRIDTMAATVALERPDIWDFISSRRVAAPARRQRSAPRELVAA
jgi:N-acyl amino acid synthase of PEP-CTERM/exosortase system